ncbi:MAG: prepilin-type N-terminal cleavage/methylation domain-containing protein [Planctomycetota bacterium]|jgi:prepilin-type N-terminal cleavage/methylation domain-containing protein
MTQKHVHLGARRAFTLIESMATVVVLAVLASITSFLIVNSVDGYTEAATTAQLHAEASIALDRAMREIRKIELKDTGVAPNITSINAAGDSIQWTDVDTDSYALSLVGTNLELTVKNVGPAVLLSDVTAFSVQAYNESNAVMVNPLSGGGCDNIRRIALDVTLARSGVSQSLRTKVFIRSTMSGAG